MAPLLECIPEDSKNIITVKRLWTVKNTVPVFRYHITKRHKVVRSYQCYAAYKIADGVAKNDWKDGRQLGGYVWHTTGSGKTMTSFKADNVQETEDTITLISKLKSIDPKDTLIVSSIQKMSNIKEDAEGRMRVRDLENIRSKRIVFIIDECHRSTFGEMLTTIKATFPNALFFGFTGTPVFEENEKAMNTTADIFGDELHRYSIADGIRDKNVLGFNPSMVMVYRDKDVRQQVAIREAGGGSLEEILADPASSDRYFVF